MIEKPVSHFGLLGDAENILGRARRNILLASSVLRNLKAAFDSGSLAEIEPDIMEAMLKAAIEALDAVSR